MVWRRRSLLSVVVPAYDVADYLPECLDSVLAQERPPLRPRGDRGRRRLDATRTGAIADSYAAADARVRVVHTANAGLGAARNEGFRHVGGSLLAFADSDDVVPPGAYAALLKEQRRSGSDLVTGSIARLAGSALEEPPWMRRLHKQRMDVDIDSVPEILGDVFAWNKLYRVDFWRSAGLSWPEGVRYEDQPTTTLAYLRARRFAIIPDVVYHWRIRTDGSSITQQRSSLADLRDRWTTKQAALASVEAYGSRKVTGVFRDRVLAGDLHRYFTEIPGCSDEWWDLLHSGVVALWGERSLTHSGLLPVDRLVGWLVEQGRRTDADAVVTYALGLGRPSTASRPPTAAAGSTCPPTCSTWPPSPPRRWRSRPRALTDLRRAG